MQIRLIDIPVILTSIIMAWTESFLALTTSHLPDFIINFFTRSASLFYSIPRNKYVALSDEITPQVYETMLGILHAGTIHEMAGIFGYELEDKIVRTGDGYLLTVQRIVAGPRARKSNGKVVYFHHGLLMNSEVWMTMIEEYDNLPLVLYDMGYDVWLGNNRGNKYSQKHLVHKLKSEQFWDFSLDEFALFDIPNTIDYILEHTGQEKLTYIGFSQGTAQAFASVAVNTDLNRKIDQIIAISPATTPHRLCSKLLDILFKSSPNFMYLLFSNKVLLPSTIFWQSIIYPPLFITIIDFCIKTLFNWRSRNIRYVQKVASYAHLYSTTSVKTVAHWFQIMASKKFQMYHDNYTSLSGLKTIPYPLRSIRVPIHLIYGTTDSLVDISVMKSQLPPHTTCEAIDGHEHLDNLWGQDVNERVFKKVIRWLEKTQESTQEAQSTQEALSTQEAQTTPTTPIAQIDTKDSEGKDNSDFDSTTLSKDSESSSKDTRFPGESSGFTSAWETLSELHKGSGEYIKEDLLQDDLDNDQLRRRSTGWADKYENGYNGAAKDVANGASSASNGASKGASKSAFKSTSNGSVFV